MGGSDFSPLKSCRHRNIVHTIRSTRGFSSRTERHSVFMQRGLIIVIRGPTLRAWSRASSQPLVSLSIFFADGGNVDSTFLNKIKWES